MIGAALRLVRDILLRDPPFVRGGPLSSGEVPVFTFHTLEPSSFERRVSHLTRNGYRTPSLEEYAAAVETRTSLPAKSVLLTIDDGRATTWTVGYPILKRHGLRAVSFLVTSVVHDSSDVGATWEGGTEPGLARETDGEHPFVTWGEVERMQGVIEPESHTHRHALVAIGPDIRDRLRADRRRGYSQFDVPFVWFEGSERRGADLPVGHPLPGAAPRLSSHPAYLPHHGRFETPAERREAILREFTDARRALRDRAGRDSLAVCYPWHVAAPDVPELARQAGHRLGFGGKVGSDKPSDPLLLRRVGEDYVERLPGVGRRSLPHVLREKLSRRLRPQF